MLFQDFDKVAFKGFRERLLCVLQSVGLLRDETAAEFEGRFTAREQDFAFASVVRCSLTGLDQNKTREASRPVFNAASPNVAPAFRRGSDAYAIVENCARIYLSTLPARTRLVVLLGNSDSYVEALSEVIALTRAPIRQLNPMAYVSNDVKFVHVAHPSRGNGHFTAFIRGGGTSGQKRIWAAQAITDKG